MVKKLNSYNFYPKINITVSQTNIMVNDFYLITVKLENLYSSNFRYMLPFPIGLSYTPEICNSIFLLFCCLKIGASQKELTIENL